MLSRAKNTCHTLGLSQKYTVEPLAVGYFLKCLRLTGLTLNPLQPRIVESLHHCPTTVIKQAAQTSIFRTSAGRGCKPTDVNKTRSVATCLLAAGWTTANPMQSRLAAFAHRSTTKIGERRNRDVHRGVRWSALSPLCRAICGSVYHLRRLLQTGLAVDN